MKWLITILPIFLLTCNSSLFNKEATETTDLVAKAIYIATYDINKKDYLYLVHFKIINHSTRECRFVALSCATSFSIITDPEFVPICPNNCSDNRPTFITLDKGQELTIPLLLKINQHDQTLDKDQVRFGMVLFPTQLFNIDSFSESLVNMKKNKLNVIWSQPLTLSTAGGTLFDIKKTQSEILK